MMTPSNILNISRDIPRANAHLAASETTSGIAKWGHLVVAYIEMVPILGRIVSIVDEIVTYIFNHYFTVTPQVNLNLATPDSVTPNAEVVPEESFHYFERLPAELQVAIFEFVDPRGLVSLPQVSRSFNAHFVAVALKKKLIHSQFELLLDRCLSMPNCPNLSIPLAQVGRIEEAQTLLVDADLPPPRTRTSAYHAIAVAQARAGDREAANSWCRLALKFSPYLSSVDQLCNLARDLAHFGWQDNAVTVLHQALKKAQAGGQVMVFTNYRKIFDTQAKAGLEVDSKLTKLLIASLNKAVAIRKTSTSAHVDLAYIYHSLQENELCGQHITAALEAVDRLGDTTFPKYSLMGKIAVLQALRGDETAAWAICEKAFHLGLSRGYTFADKAYACTTVFRQPRWAQLFGEKTQEIVKTLRSEAASAIEMEVLTLGRRHIQKVAECAENIARFAPWDQIQRFFEDARQMAVTFPEGLMRDIEAHGAIAAKYLVERGLFEEASHLLNLYYQNYTVYYHGVPATTVFVHISQAVTCALKARNYDDAKHLLRNAVQCASSIQNESEGCAVLVTIVQECAEAIGSL